MSEKKLLPDDTAELLERLNQTLVAARMALWDWDLRTDAVTFLSNAANVFGINDECVEDPWSMVMPGYRDQIEHLRHSILATRSSATVVVAAVKPADQAHVWLELSASPAFDETGKLVRLRGTAQDVTREKRAEALSADLERQRYAADARAIEVGERLALAVDAADLGVFYCPMPMDKIYWNTTCKKHFFLPEDAEVDFDLFYSLLHPDDRECTRIAIANAVFEKRVYDVEYRTVGPHGQTRWIRAKGLTYYNDQGEPIRFDGITIDIQRQKELEASLEHANQQKDDFLAMLAHELRNPLAPISAASSVLGLPKLDHDRVQSSSAIISRQVKHMASLLDDLMDVSRVTRGKVDLQLAPVDFKAVVSAAAEQVLPLVRRKEHRLGMHLPPERIDVLGDEKRLIQVVVNILTNAARYTPNGGVIDLVLTVMDEQAVLVISDNGVGMSPTLLRTAFDLFVQGERTLDRGQGGLGIGLSLVKHLTELHGGSIEAHSDGPGLGSRITVRLKLHMDTADTDKDPYEPTTVAEQRSMKIMIVDDNDDAAKALAMLLSAVGYDVSAETNPQRALEGATRNAPDLLIVDIGMPIMDGYELARRLRAQPQTKSCHLVALTGYGQAQDYAKAESAGFDYHLVKPVKIDALLSLLDSLQAN